MKNLVRRRASKMLSRHGMSLQREFPRDMSPETMSTVLAVRPHTMTSIARIEAVCAAAEHIVRSGIPGAFVESGVWMGGSSMAAALTLIRLGAADRDIYLFDTFRGIPAPGENDGIVGSDLSVGDWWRRENKGRGPAWLDAPVDAVRANIAATGYPMNRVHLVEGLVEETVPASAPQQIALLRLDTDWYSSTKVEMEVMFPRVSEHGVLIVDDYGFTEGCRKAVDEFLRSYDHPVFLQRIDDAGRLAIKPRG